MEKQEQAPTRLRTLWQKLQRLIVHLATPGGFMSVYYCESRKLFTTQDREDVSVHHKHFSLTQLAWTISSQPRATIFDLGGGNALLARPSVTGAVLRR